MRTSVKTGAGVITAIAGLLLMLGAVLLRIPSLKQPMDRDMALYAAIGQWANWDTLPYRDLFDHKQPLIYGVYWALHKLAPHSLVAIRLTAALVAGLAAVLVFVLLVRRGRALAAVAATLTLVLGASPLLQGADLNTEHLLGPFSVAAVLLPLVARDEVGRRRDLLLALAGVCAGISVLCKVIGAAVVVPALILVLSPVLGDRRAILRSVLVYLGAAAVPVVLVIAFYAAAGSLSDFWFGNWTYNRRYLDQYVTAYGRRPWTAITHLSVLVALSGAAVTAYLGARQGRSALAWATLLWLATTFLSGLFGARDFAHYYVPVIPPAAIALALPIAALASRPLRGLGIALAAIVLVTWLPSVTRTFGRNGDEMVAAVYGEGMVPIWATATRSASSCGRAGSMATCCGWPTPSRSSIGTPAFSPRRATSSTTRKTSRPPRSRARSATRCSQGHPLRRAAHGQPTGLRALPRRQGVPGGFPRRPGRRLGAAVTPPPSPKEQGPGARRLGRLRPGEHVEPGR